MTATHIDTLSKGLAETITKRALFEPNRGDTHRAIEELVSQQLSLITQENKVSCTDMWSAMKVWDKLTWWVVTMLLPWVGKAIRGQHRQATLAWYRAEQEGLIWPSCSELPYWAHEKPWELIVAKVFFIPRSPMQRISVSFRIGPAGAETIPESFETGLKDLETGRVSDLDCRG